jgi:hypothetical protein
LSGAAAPALLELRVQVPEGSELAREFGVPRGWRFAVRIEISPAEQVGGCNDGGSHGAIFISPLRPCQILSEPKVEAHGPILQRAIFR